MAGGRQYERIPVPFWNLEISRGKTTFPSNIMTTMSSENVNQLQKRGPLLNLQIYNVYNFSLRSAQVTSMQWWFRIFWYRLISHFLHPPQFKKRSLFLPWIRNSSPCPWLHAQVLGWKCFSLSQRYCLGLLSYLTAPCFLISPSCNRRKFTTWLRGCCGNTSIRWPDFELKVLFISVN